VTLAAVTLAVVLLAGGALSSSSHSYSDRLVAAGDIFAAGTLALALVAGIVAVMAYVAATGRPALMIQIDFGQMEFGDEQSNSAVLRGDGHAAVVAFDTQAWQIRLRNYSSYSAKSPAVVIRFQGIWLRSPEGPLGYGHHWYPLDNDDSLGVTRVTAVQWDAEPTESVHGYSVRRLPSVGFRRLLFNEEQSSSRSISPLISFELLAEGYRRVVTLPVKVGVEVDYNPLKADPDPLLLINEDGTTMALRPLWI
jgi:hypothetical protein